MRYFFPYRRTAGGTLKIEIQDSKAGDYEILSDKYFLSIEKVNEEIESDLGTLRLADVNLGIVDIDRKFRDGIFTGDDQKFLKLLYEERQRTYLTPKGIDLDGSTEFLFSSSPDFDLNGPEEMTNAGFETNVTGWSISQASSRSNAYAHSGSWSLENVGGATPDYDEFVFDSNRMHQATVEAWVRILSYTSGAISLEVLDNSNNVLASRNANTGTVGSWQKLALNIDSILVRKIRLRNTGDAVVYWDDVSVTRAWDLTAVAWVKMNALPASWAAMVSKGFANSAPASGWNIFVNNAGALQARMNDDVGGEVSAYSSLSVGDFHLIGLTIRRTGTISMIKDGTLIAGASVSGKGNCNSTRNLEIGTASAQYFTGIVGEVMIIKGWAADAATIVDWYANGIRMRSDTIGFWRWHHPTDVGKDYSGKGHSLTLQNVDSNDIYPGDAVPQPGWEGNYKQRAQVSESLFYGVAKLAPQGHDEKKDAVKLIAYSPLKDLDNTSLDDLWGAIQAGGYLETRTAYHPLVSGDPIYNPPTVQAVNLSNVLRAMGSLIGCSTLSAETAWRFGIEAAAPYAVDFGFDNLYVITDENGSGVFDTIFTRSALSWRNLYANCSELLKAIQLALFAFARGEYDPDRATGILGFRQRGLPNESAVVPAGKLLEYTREYVENGGVLVKNLYGLPLSPYPPTPTPAEMQSQFGTGDVEIALPFKTYERRIFDYGYAYLYASWQPSTTDELVTNGNFETNTAGWTLNGASSRDNTRAYSGSWSLKDAGASGSFNEWVIPQDLQHDLIQVQAMLWCGPGSPLGSGQAKIELLGPNDEVLCSQRRSLVNQWEDMGGWGLFGIGVKKVRLYGNGTAVAVYWDALSAHAVAPGYLTDGIFVCNKLYPHGWPLNGALHPNLHCALANAYGLSSVGQKEMHVRTFHRPTVIKDGIVSMEHSRVLEREEFPYRGEVMNLETVKTELDIEKNVMTRWGVRR